MHENYRAIMASARTFLKIEFEKVMIDELELSLFQC